MGSYRRSFTRRLVASLCVAALAAVLLGGSARAADGLRVVAVETGPTAVLLHVAVPGPGRLAATGARGSQQALLPAGRVVREGETAAMIVRLSRSTRARLLTRSVRVCVALRFKGVDGSVMTTARYVVLERMRPVVPAVTG